MNCATLTRVLDLVDLDARFDRDAAARHLARCASCRRRYPEILALLATAPAESRRRRRSPRAARIAAAGLLLAATLALATRDTRSSRAAADGAPPAARSEATTAELPASPRAIRHLPVSASRVVYTSRRLVAANDSRAVQSVVVRGGARSDFTFSVREDFR